MECGLVTGSICVHMAEQRSSMDGLFIGLILRIYWMKTLATDDKKI